MPLHYKVHDYYLLIRFLLLRMYSVGIKLMETKREVCWLLNLHLLSQVFFKIAPIKYTIIPFYQIKTWSSKEMAVPDWPPRQNFSKLLQNCEKRNCFDRKPGSCHIKPFCCPLYSSPHLFLKQLLLEQIRGSKSSHLLSDAKISMGPNTFFL